jgi:hypothetical protein
MVKKMEVLGGKVDCPPNFVPPQKRGSLKLKSNTNNVDPIAKVKF